MKRLISIAFAFLVPLIVFAIPMRMENSLAIRGGVGYNNVHNFLPETTAPGGGALQLGLGYRLHDRQNGFLFHAGMEMAYGMSIMTHNDMTEQKSMLDTESEPMLMIYDIQSIRETQQYVSGGIELLLGYQSRKGWYALAGPKFAYTFYNPVHSASIVTARGRYPNLIEDLANMPDHFFSTTHNSATNIYPAMPKISLALELGYTVHLSNWRLRARSERTKDFQIALFAEYGYLFKSGVQPYSELIASYSEGAYSPQVNPFLWYNVNSNRVANLTCGIKMTYLFNWRSCLCH